MQGVRVYSTVQCTYKLHVYKQGGGGGGVGAGQPAYSQLVSRLTPTHPQGMGLSREDPGPARTDRGPLSP